MGIKHSLRSTHAVSEVVGGMLLIIIAVIAFASIYIYLYPPGPELEVSSEIEGSVNEKGMIVLSHMGGDSLSDYKIMIKHPNGTLIGEKTINDDIWKIGDTRYPLEQLNVSYFSLVNETIKVDINVYSLKTDGEYEEIFSGRFSGKVQDNDNIYLLPEDILYISTLFTNTSDEDLICLNNTIEPNITAKTYIYNWIVNGNSLCDVYLPFDTNDDSIAKDYSNNNKNGTINGATWSNQGVVGGCYYFDGQNNFIEGEMPNVFENVDYNDFSVSLWVKSSDISAEWKVLMEARYDNKNFVRLFQQGNEIHFGVTEDGTKYVIRTDNLTSNDWYHITGVWDASEKLPHIYVNGIESNITGNRNYPYGAQAGFNIGHGTAGSGGHWYGYVDEFQIFNRALSAEQIYQIYLSTKDGFSDKSVVVSEETIQGQTWKCIVTPNDSTQDDTSIESNELQLVSYGGG